MAVFTGAKLFPKQKEIVNGIINTPDIDGAVSWHVVCCSRQFGKSFILKQLLLYYAINEPNSKILFVSMTHQQSNKVFNEILKAIEKSPLIKQKNAKENSLILMNGSEIYIRSYQRCDFIRGISANTLIVDEASFIKAEDFQSILRPTLSTIGRRGLLFSTPKGKNFFYEMAMDKSPNYHYYHATYRDNPIANLSEIEDARQKLPEAIFRSEYEAEFISGSMSVFQNIEKCIVDNLRPDGPCYAGIDVGRNNDYTVLTIMSNNKVVYQEQWNMDTWENIILHILEGFRKYNVKACWVEINGLGDPFFEMLFNACRSNRINLQLNTWLTTNVSKQNIIEKLIQDFASGTIQIPNNQELINQLNNFEAEYSAKTKSVIYSGKMNGHDDRVMALAICNYNKPQANRGHYHVVTI